MTTMVENKKSSGQRPPKPNPGIAKGFDSAAVRFDKIETDMREGFDRVDRAINGLRGEMNGLRGDTKDQGDGLRGEINGLRGQIKDQGDGLRGEINGLRGDITALGDRLRDEMNVRFLAIESGFKSFQNTMIGTVVVGLIVNKLL